MRFARARVCGLSCVRFSAARADIRAPWTALGASHQMLTDPRVLDGQFPGG